MYALGYDRPPSSLMGIGHCFLRSRAAVACSVPSMHRLEKVEVCCHFPHTPSRLARRLFLFTCLQSIKSFRDIPTEVCGLYIYIYIYIYKLFCENIFLYIMVIKHSICFNCRSSKFSDRPMACKVLTNYINKLSF